MTEPKLDRTRSQAWRDGFAAGHAGKMMAAPDPATASDWTSGYLVGARSKWSDDLMDAWEAEDRASGR